MKSLSQKCATKARKEEWRVCSSVPFESCAARRDEGRPLGVGLQKQVPNRLKLRQLSTGVVSVKEKAWKPCQVWVREMNTSEPLMRCRNGQSRRQNWRLLGSQEKSRRQSAYCLGGVRHRSGVNLIQASVWNVGNCRPDAKGENPSGGPTRMRVPMRGTVAEQSVLAMKVRNGIRAKGLHYPALLKGQPFHGRNC